MSGTLGRFTHLSSCRSMHPRLPDEARNRQPIQPIAGGTRTRPQRRTCRQRRRSLIHWKLVTKDGSVRDGENVTAEMVKELVDTGMAPAWCIGRVFLQRRGRKGEPRPSRSFMDADRNPVPHRRVPTVKVSEAIADDTAYLKQIIRTLEQQAGSGAPPLRSNCGEIIRAARRQRPADQCVGRSDTRVDEGTRDRPTETDRGISSEQK